MTLIGNFIRTVAVAAALVALPASSLMAQEISPSHLAAALDVIHATTAAASFDTRLPQIANEVTNRLIRARPDLHQEIADTVQAVALKLVVAAQASSIRTSPASMPRRSPRTSSRPSPPSSRARPARSIRPTDRPSSATRCRRSSPGPIGSAPSFSTRPRKS